MVSVVAILAIGVNAEGRREVLGLDVGPSEAATFWTEFLRKLVRRGLGGVELVTSDAHEGIKAAVARVLSTGCSTAARISSATCATMPPGAAGA